MTQSEREALIAALGAVVVAETKRALEPLQAQLGRLELKLEYAELQAKELRYAGVWNEKSVYRRNNFVTHGGSVWACVVDGIQTQPGHDHSGWQLAVKSMARA
jgi:hypothetical protein